jgi:hypothetical protein
MPLHDVHYQHWNQQHTSIWMRRWVIARNGLTAALGNKLIRNLAVLCWMLGLITAAELFLAGQLLVADSVISQWVEKLNPQLQAFAKMLTQWLEDHPEISVATTQNVLFYFFSILLMPIGIFALGIALPTLITRDLASNAVVIYSSKAVTRGDYLLGKFCTAFGLLTITWLGPACAAWFLGNLLAPDWRFFWHARAALFHAMLFGVSGAIVLSALALGISATSNHEKATPAIWFMWWILGGVLQPIAEHTRPWLRHLSFSYDLRQIGLSTFQLGKDLNTVQDNVPIFGQMLHGIRSETRDALNHPNVGGAIVAVILMLAAASFIIRQRVKPE